MALVGKGVCSNTLNARIINSLGLEAKVCKTLRDAEVSSNEREEKIEGENIH